MTLPNKPLPYQAKLLRMWVESSVHHPLVWRFSLEDIETGKRSGFGDLDHLIGHLLAVMDEHPKQEQLDNAQQQG